MSEQRDERLGTPYPFEEWIDKDVTVTLIGQPDEEGNHEDFTGVLVSVIPQGVFVEEALVLNFVPWSGMIWMEKAREEARA